MLAKLLIEREGEHMRIIKRSHEREKRREKGRMTLNSKEREILMWLALEKAKKIFKDLVISMVLKTGPRREPERGVVPVSLVRPGSDRCSNW